VTGDTAVALAPLLSVSEQCAFALPSWWYPRKRRLMFTSVGWRAGSPQGLIPGTCKRPKCCWRSWA